MTQRKTDMTLPSFIASLFAWLLASPANQEAKDSVLGELYVCMGLYRALLGV